MSAGPGDAPAFHDIVAAAGLPLAGLDDAAVQLVAEQGGQVVGTGALEEHAEAAGQAFLLPSVAVRPELRDEGIGARLTAAALEQADCHGVPVALLTESAPGYFLHSGFIEVSRDELPTALGRSAELRGACAVSTRAFLRPSARPEVGRP